MSQLKVTSYYTNKKRTARTKANINKNDTVEPIDEITALKKSTNLKTTAVKAKADSRKTRKVKQANDIPRIQAAFEAQKSTRNKDSESHLAIPVTKKTVVPQATTSKEVETEHEKHTSAPSTPKRGLSNPEKHTPPIKKVKSPTCTKHDVAESDEVETLKKGKDSKARKKLDLGATSAPVTLIYQNEKTVKNESDAEKEIKNIVKEVKQTKLNKKEAKAGQGKKAKSKQEMVEKLNKDILVASNLTDDAKSKLLSRDTEKLIKEKLPIFLKHANILNQTKNNSCLITSIICSEDVEKVSESKLQTQQPEKEAAWIRFSHLASDESLSLCFPFKFKLLSEMFRCVDTIVSMLNNRKETCTFDKLQSGVQDMMKKTFTKNHFGQIMTVFPTAFHLRIEEMNSAFINQKQGTDVHQIVILPNLDQKNLESEDTMDSNRSKNQNSNNQSSSKPTSFTHMDSSSLVQRTQIFSQRLMQILMNHHKKFLLGLSPPVSIPDEKLRRWHPKFPLDKVPDIEVASLPEPPQQKISTAKDVLNKIKESRRGKIEKALQIVADKNDSKSSNDSSISDAIKGSGSNPSSSVLLGVCSDLLARIRARENVQIVENMTRNTQQAKKRAMRKRLPEIVRILRTYFIVERSPVVSLDNAVQKIIDSLHSSLTPDAVKEHIELISEILPDWLKVIKITKGVFLKIDRNKNINEMLDNLPMP